MLHTDLTAPQQNLAYARNIVRPQPDPWLDTNTSILIDGRVIELD